jgi:transposase InsO family protein
MKYAFIQRNKLVWPICVQCRVLLVSVSGYHEHLARRVDISRRRHLSDEALLVHISAAYAENRGAYGWPRIWRQLRAQGIRVGKLRVQRLMQKHGIQARGKRRFRVVTTDSKRNPGKRAGLIFHSDRGSQYASEDFSDVLKEHGITPSMSRKGNCWDNACSETLFSSLKVERLHGQRFQTIREAKDEVIAWLLWYNRTRMHSTLNYVSPMQFEQDWTDAAAKIAA